VAYPIDISVRSTWCNRLQLAGCFVFSNIIPGSSVARFNRLKKRHYIAEEFDAVIINIGLSDFVFKKDSAFEHVNKLYKHKVKTARRAKMTVLSDLIAYRLLDIFKPLFSRAKQQWQPQTELKDFETSFNSLIDYAQSHSDKVIVVGLPAGTDDYHAKRDKEMDAQGASRALARQYNDVIIKASEQVNYIDVSKFDNVDYLPDGFHYAEKTHGEIFEIIKSILWSN
jgi:hypothetical protein